MKHPLARRAVAVASALGVAASLGLASATPASAATVPPNTIVIAAGGSDTTEKLMGDILTQGVPSNERWYNVPSFPTSAFNVPADTQLNDCPETNWVPSAPNGSATPQEILAPSGSGAGRTQLNASAGNATAGQKGCLDIARSSSFGTNAAGTFKSFAFALDAVSWASPSLQAPSVLKKSDLKKIYACQITDWSQLPGGGSGPIQRYLPNPNSGTRGFFISDLLDNITIPGAQAGCPAVKEIGADGNTLEENSATQIPDADWQKAILPYSSGQWVFQANNSFNPTLDKRKSFNGGFTTKLGGLIDDVANPTTPVNAQTAGYNLLDGGWQLNDTGLQIANTQVDASYPLGPVVESNSKKANAAGYQFAGIRYLYNVVDSRSPAYTPPSGYAGVLDIVGFTNTPAGAKSPLCAGQRSTTIQAYGFSPLPTSGNPLGTNLAGSTCRLYTV